MAFLSQASHLGSLLLPHDAFQEYAAHPAEWSAELNSKGSERTCIRSGLATFLHCAFTAHAYLVVDLWVFVERPEVAMDNNAAERALRNPVVGRKNYYGS